MKTRKKYTKKEQQTVVDMWVSGAGRVKEIAEAMNMPKTTVYGILERAGVWPGVDDYMIAKAQKAKSELEALLDEWPMAKLQVELNKAQEGKPNRNKVSIELAKFMATAASAGFSFKELADVTYVDAKTVAKYAREMEAIARRRRLPPLAQAQNMSLPIQYVGPEPGLLRRAWNWLFG